MAPLLACPPACDPARLAFVPTCVSDAPSVAGACFAASIPTPFWPGIPALSRTARRRTDGD
jgi:hypothetical protein